MSDIPDPLIMTLGVTGLELPLLSRIRATTPSPAPRRIRATAGRAAALGPEGRFAAVSFGFAFAPLARRSAPDDLTFFFTGSAFAMSPPGG
jgi:hypothetical protein